MSYQPVIPTGGNVGWTFLSRTREDQSLAHRNSSGMQRNTEYFRQNISSVKTAEDLVSDRKLLSVALGAFGLDEDINNKFFIQKVLEEGTLNEEAFANRLSDKRYFALAESFGFHLTPPNTVLSDFPDRIVPQYQERQFELAVGDQDQDLRLALGVERDIAELSSRELSEEAAWLTVMGTPPLRRVFENALNLPAAMAAIDLDQQLETFRDRAGAQFGVSHPGDFTDPELQEKLVRNFLFRSELAANAASTSSGAVALSLLQSLASSA